MARQRGIRSVLKVNYEWLEFHSKPDLYAAPNAWHFSDIPEPKAIIPLPVDLERFKFRQRTQARTFLHVVGHDAGHDRNGTTIFVDALKHVRSDVRFLVRAQVPLVRLRAFDHGMRLFEDERLHIWCEDVAANESLYASSDVLVFPRRYGGQSLVMDEAAACGLPMITTYMEPQRTLFRASSIFCGLRDVSTVRVKREVECADVDPKLLAAWIDTAASGTWDGMIARMSTDARATIAERSWKAWVEALQPR